MDRNTLILNANSTIAILSASVLENMAESRAVKSENQELSDVLYLSASVNFAILELSTILKAMICANTPYAKRYHSKNLKASTSECYKMLYHYDNIRKHSIWSKFKNVVDKFGTDLQKQQYAETINLLNSFGEHQIDKELRDVAMHYDEDLLSVYRMTVALKSEEDAAKYYCDFNDILRKMQFLTNEIASAIRDNIQNDKSHDIIKIKANLLSNEKSLIIQGDDKLRQTIDYVLGKAPKELDSIADTDIKLKNFIEKLEQSAKELLLEDNDVLFAEMSVPLKLTNIQMLLRFMFNDVMAIYEAVNYSINDFESSLHLRRLVIHQAALITLLFGYEKKNKYIPLWRDLLIVAPGMFLEQKNQIEALSQTILPLVNSNKRHAFVHLYEHNGAVCLTPFMEEIDKLDFKYEMGLTSLFALLYGELMKFLTELLVELSAEKHRESEESTKRVLAMFDSVIDLMYKVPMEDNIRTQRIEQLTNLKNKLAEL